MSQLYDEELLTEVDDDIVKPRNAPPRHSSGWGVLSIVIAVVVGVVIGAVLAINDRPDSAQTSMPTKSTAAVDEETILRMSELEVLVEEDPTNVENRLELAELYWSIGNLEMAKSQVDEVLSLDPKNSDAWFLLGMYYWFEEPPQCAEVERAWNKYMELDPDGDHEKVLAHMQECTLIVAEQETPVPTGR